MTNNSLSDKAREKLTAAIRSEPFSGSPPPRFRPDYCIACTDAQGNSEALWIDSNEYELQLQLFVGGNPFPFISGIAKLAGGSVQAALCRVVTTAELPWDASLLMYNELNKNKQLEMDILAINPTEAADVFDKKHWRTVGTWAVTDPSERSAALTEFITALNKDFLPDYTASVFKPHVAIFAKIAAGPKPGKYLFLMSVDCRLAELYIDGELQGGYVISTGWKPKAAGLPLELSTDQPLYDILSVHGQATRAKTTSSSN